MDQPAPALPGHGADVPSTMPTLAEVLQQMTLDMASQIAEMQAAGEMQPGTAALGSDNVPLRGKSAVPRAHSAPPAGADDATPMDARPVSENWLDQLPRNTAKSAQLPKTLIDRIAAGSAVDSESDDEENRKTIFEKDALTIGEVPKPWKSYMLICCSVVFDCNCRKMVCGTDFKN